MKIKGEWNSRRVWIGDTELLPDRSQKEYNHSPDGFNWGYAGSGPSQLALAIMLVYSPTKDFAVHWYQDFKREVISALSQNEDFVFDDEIVKEWISRKLSSDNQ